MKALSYEEAQSNAKEKTEALQRLVSEVQKKYESIQVKLKEAARSADTELQALDEEIQQEAQKLIVAELGGDSSKIATHKDKMNELQQRKSAAKEKASPFQNIDIRNFFSDEWAAIQLAGKELLAANKSLHEIAYAESERLKTEISRLETACEEAEILGGHAYNDTTDIYELGKVLLFMPLCIELDFVKFAENSPFTQRDVIRSLICEIPLHALTLEAVCK